MLIRILSIIKKFAIYILPITFLILSILIHFNSGKFFLSNVDPEYFHLFNGLNFSIFNLSIEYIFHPGTTLQVIYAVSAHIVNLIQPGNDIIINALNNPEQFIHGANILLNIITGIALFATGFYTYKHTGNIFFALLLQLMPFGNFHILLVSARLIPEAVLTAPLLLLVLLVVRLLHDQKRDENTKKYLIGFAIIGALGIAGKMLYFPFLIIPLFLFKSSNDKLKYLLYTFIAILILAFPLFVNLSKSWDWYSNMLFHSGKWGGGENKIVDLKTFPDNINKIFHIDKSLFLLSGLLSIELLIISILDFIKKQQENKLLFRVIVGFLSALILSVIIVTKHFAAHYFYPTLLLKIFLLYLMAELLVSAIKVNRLKSIIPLIALIIALFISFGQVKPLKSAIKHKINRATTYQNQFEEINKYHLENSILIISPHYRGSPFIQSAMVGGILVSGGLKSTFVDILLEKYPNTYFYFSWTDELSFNDMFYLWDEFIYAKDFVDPLKPVYVFIGKEHKNDLEPIISRIERDFPEYIVEINMLHQFPILDEYLYQVNLIKSDP